MSLELYERLERAETVATVVGDLLSALLLFMMLGDLLGVPLPELLRAVLTLPWKIRIPEWLVEQYMVVWASMRWALFVLMVIDCVYTRMYVARRDEPPPVGYARAVSLLMMLVSFWLAIIFQSGLYSMICLLSAISFAFLAFGREAG